MRAHLITIWLLLFGLASAAQAGEVGFQKITVANGADAPLEVGVWYPTEAKAEARPLELFTQTVASGAPVAGRGLPLIVFSHGNGGSLAGHYDTALALAAAGFVVAAPTHTGDNWRDQSRATRISDRPRQIKAVTDYMLLNWSEHGRLDPRRVGGFGFSSGGLTMLIAAGGVPDISKIRPYCLLHPGEYVCLLLRRAGPTPTATVPADVWTHEVRLKALVIAAPALGFAFAPDGLKTVTVPMQLWRAERDRVLPSPNYVEPVRDALPTPPEYHVAAGADHWDFLAPCSAALAKVAAPICGEIGSFDRVAFHQSFDRDVVAFFTATLKR